LALPKLDVLKRFRADKQHLILTDTSATSRRWVRKDNKKFLPQIRGYLGAAARITKKGVWTYIVISAVSPPMNGFRVAGYPPAEGFNKSTFRTVAFNDFKAEIISKLPELAKGQTDRLEIVGFELSKHPLREAVQVQLGAGMYEWQPFERNLF
jgi:hypothetical protein